MDMVNHPAHYENNLVSKLLRRECIEYTRHLHFSDGNSFKYVWRCYDKNSTVQDLNKALFYLKDAMGHGVPPRMPAYLVSELCFYVDNRGDVRDAGNASDETLDQLEVLHAISLGQYGVAARLVHENFLRGRGEY